MAPPPCSAHPHSSRAPLQGSGWPKNPMARLFCGLATMPCMPRWPQAGRASLSTQLFLGKKKKHTMGPAPPAPVKGPPRLLEPRPCSLLAAEAGRSALGWDRSSPAVEATHPPRSPCHRLPSPPCPSAPSAAKRCPCLLRCWAWALRVSPTQPQGCLGKLLNSCSFKEKAPQLAVVGETSHHTFPHWEKGSNFTPMPFPDHAGEGTTSQRHVSVLPGGTSTLQLQHSPAVAMWYKHDAVYLCAGCHVSQGWLLQGLAGNCRNSVRKC